MSIFSALIGGAASLIGGRMNNAANAQQAAQTNDFNAQQGQIARDFTADQAQITRDFNSAEADENRQFNSAEAVTNRDFQAQQAQINRAYQTDMANTSYQRGTADMKAAGINPMLAYMKGGAAVPTGGQASGSQATGTAASASASSASPVQGHKAQMNDVITPAINSALQLRRNTAEVDLMEAEADKKRAEARTEANRPANVDSDTRLKGTQADLNNEQRQVAFHNIAKIIADTNLIGKQEKLTLQQIDQSIEQTRLLTQQQKQTIQSAITLMKQGDLYEAQAKLARLQVPEQEASASFYTDTGQTSKVMEVARQLSIILRSFK